MALIGPECILASREKGLFDASLARDAKPDDRPTFYGRFLYTPVSLKSAEWGTIIAAIMSAGSEKFGEKFAVLFKEGGIRSPIRKDIASKGYDPEMFAAFVNAKGWEDSPPALFMRAAGPDGKPLKLTNRAELYPGVRVRCMYSVRAYDHPKGGKGIALDLRGVQKLGDAARLSIQRDDDGAGFGALDAEPAAGMPGEGNDPSLESMLS